MKTHTFASRAAGRASSSTTRSALRSTNEFERAPAYRGSWSLGIRHTAPRKAATDTTPKRLAPTNTATGTSNIAYAIEAAARRTAVAVTGVPCTAYSMGSPSTEVRINQSAKSANSITFEMLGPEHIEHEIQMDPSVTLMERVRAMPRSRPALLVDVAFRSSYLGVDHPHDVRERAIDARVSTFELKGSASKPLWRNADKHIGLRGVLRTKSERIVNRDKPLAASRIWARNPVAGTRLWGPFASETWKSANGQNARKPSEGERRAYDACTNIRVKRGFVVQLPATGAIVTAFTVRYTCRKPFRLPVDHGAIEIEAELAEPGTQERVWDELVAAVRRQDSTRWTLRTISLSSANTFDADGVPDALRLPDVAPFVGPHASEYAAAKATYERLRPALSVATTARGMRGVLEPPRYLPDTPDAPLPAELADALPAPARLDPNPRAVFRAVAWHFHNRAKGALVSIRGSTALRVALFCNPRTSLRCWGVRDRGDWTLNGTLVCDQALSWSHVDRRLGAALLVIREAMRTGRVRDVDLLLDVRDNDPRIDPWSRERRAPVDRSIPYALFGSAARLARTNCVLLPTPDDVEMLWGPVAAPRRSPPYGCPPHEPLPNPPLAERDCEAIFAGSLTGTTNDLAANPRTRLREAAKSEYALRVAVTRGTKRLRMPRRGVVEGPVPQLPWSDRPESMREQVRSYKIGVYVEGNGPAFRLGTLLKHFAVAYVEPEGPTPNSWLTPTAERHAIVRGTPEAVVRGIAPLDPGLEPVGKALLTRENAVEYMVQALNRVSYASPSDADAFADLRCASAWEGLLDAAEL